MDIIDRFEKVEKGVAKKTDISGSIKTFFKKSLIGLICLPFIPVFFLYVLIRNCFTKKAISIDKLVKIK